MLISAFSQTSEERVYAASKGDTVRYDSAAVMDVRLYRLVRKQVNTGMAFVDTLQSYISVQHEQEARQEQIINNLLEDLDLSTQRLVSKDSIITSQSRLLESYHTELNKPKPKGIFRRFGKWFEQSWQEILVGIGIGVMLTR